MAEMPAGCALLILEDEFLIRFDIEEMVSDAGHTATSVETLAKAKAALAVSLPTVAILDVRLPEGDTFAFARELLAKQVAVVFVTGYAPGIPEDLAGCPVVEKPFTQEDILAAVEAARSG